MTTTIGDTMQKLDFAPAVLAAPFLTIRGA